MQTYTTSYIGQRAMHDLRMEIFSHLQRQDLAYFDRNAVGRLMTRTINDVETLNELFSTGVVGLMGDVSIVFGIAFVMFWLDWQLALVCLAAFPVILYISRFYRQRAREVYRESRMILGRLNADLQENIAGVATIQAFGQEERMYRRFQDVNLSYRNVLLRSIRYNALFFPVIEVFSAISIGLLLWYGAHQIFASTVQAGVLVAFIQYIQRMYQPIRDLAEKYNVMQAAMASSERILPCSTSRRRSPIRPNRSGWKNSSAKLNSKTSGFPTGRASRCSKVFPFASGPAKRSPWWAPPAAARRRSSPRSAASTMSKPAQILVDGIDVREWNKQELRRHLGSGVARCVSFFRRYRDQHHPRRPAHQRTDAWSKRRARAQIAPFIEKLPERFPRRSPRARLDFVAGAAAVIVFCPGARVRPENSHS